MQADKERLDAQLLKAKSQTHEFAAKLAAAIKAHQATKAELQSVKAQASSNAVIAVSQPPSIAVVAATTASAPLTPLAMGSAAAAVANGVGETDALLGSLGAGMPELERKRLLSRLVQATRRVYKSDKLLEKSSSLNLVAPSSVDKENVPK